MKRYVIIILLSLVYMSSYGQSESGCVGLDKKYGALLEKNRENATFLNNLLNEYSTTCVHSAVFQQAAVYLHAISPSYLSSIGCGEYYHKANRMSKSLDFYGKAISFADDNSKISDIYMRMAEIYFYNLKNFQQAREYAQKSLEIIANQAAPYFLLAELYANSNISNDDVTDAAKYWLAADLAENARTAEPTASNIDRANALIAKYSCLFPTAEQIQNNRNMNENTAYRIGGWIGRNTICRQRKCM